MSAQPTGTGEWAGGQDGIPFFYKQIDGLYVPTRLARSPWEKGKQNGVSLGGLATHPAEAVPTPVPMATARLTIDILGAAPHGPTDGRTRVVREGKRLQLIEAELLVEGRVAARAAVLRVRIEETPRFAEQRSYPAPAAAAPAGFMDSRAFGGTMETRVASGTLGETGPKTLWVRFGHQHVAGVPLSPLVRTASIADFGGGLGTMLDRDRWTSANVDISVHLVREPVGEWILCDASTASDGNGFARSDMVLADEQGAFARAHQILFVAPTGR
ncbi:MAG: thioesterase family protein [Sphingobium sp.]